MNYQKLCKQLISELRYERSWRESLQRDIRSFEKSQRQKKLRIQLGLDSIKKDLSHGDYFRGLQKAKRLDNDIFDL